jgi:hypothetical protein
MSSNLQPSREQLAIDRKLRAQLERRQLATLWGTKYFITPRLCDKIFGDGRQLVGFEPLEARPAYYIVRVDSTWDLSNWSRSEDVFADHVEEIWDALEERFGCARYYDDSPQRLNPRPFPAVTSDSGVAWFRMKWPEGLEPPPPESISPSFAAELEEVGPSL